MKKTSFAVAALALLVAVPATSYAELSFNVGAVTDYRYRGISQSRLKPAVQGGIDYSAGGFYVGTWASSIKWIKDAGGDASAEIDVYGGYKGELAKDFGYDIGVLTYQYPSNKLNPTANTTEVYGALSMGPVTAKYSHSVTNLFGFADSKNSGYYDLSGTFEATEGISITPHIGYQKVQNNSSASYADYSVTASKDFSGVVLSATVLYADVTKINGAPVYASPVGKNLGKSGFVLGLKYIF